VLGLEERKASHISCLYMAFYFLVKALKVNYRTIRIYSFTNLQLVWYSTKINMFTYKLPEGLVEVLNQ